MERFAWRLFLAAILWCFSASSQMIERDREVLILKNVIDKLDEIKTILEEQQTKSSALEESQMTMKNDMNQTLRKMADLEESQMTMKNDMNQMLHKMADLEALQSEMQNTTENILRQQLTKTAALEASQIAIRSDIREQRIVCQECATRDQVETIQNTSIAERQELLDSLQRCNVRDEFLTLYNMLKTDMDECNMGQHTCHVNATCANTIGGYNCACNLPYAGDGHTCDLVCTSPSVWINDLGCITLFSTYGYIWEEAQVRCQREGSRLTESVQKKHIDSLVHHFGETTKTKGIWVGGMREKWVSTGDTISLDLFRTGEPSRREGENCIGLLLLKDYIGLGDYNCSRLFQPLCQSYYQGIVS